MGKVKKVKISAAKRSKHLKSKKQNTKLKVAQIKTEKLKKKESRNNALDKFSLNKDKKEKKNLKRKRKGGSVNNLAENTDLNDEQIVENIRDILDDEDKIENYSDEDEDSSIKRSKNYFEDEDGNSLEKEYTKKNFAKKDESKLEIDLLPIKNKYGEIITRTAKLDYTDFKKSKLKENEEKK